MSDSIEAREWHRILRVSVRECLETWRLQAQAGPVTVEALETILARATVPILRQVEERSPELVVVLLPSAFAGMPAGRYYSSSPSSVAASPKITKARGNVTCVHVGRSSHVTRSAARNVRTIAK